MYKKKKLKTNKYTADYTSCCWAYWVNIKYSYLEDKVYNALSPTTVLFP